MNLQDILKPATREQLLTLSKSDLITLLLGEQDLRHQAEAWARILKEEKYQIGEYYVRVKNRLYGKSSERSPRVKIDGPKKNKKKPDQHTLRPSERYPNAKIVEQDIEFDPIPPCGCCGEMMVDSGMTETTEVVSVLPKQYIIKVQHYHKYRCANCHGDLKTAPTLPRIKPGSSYDDQMIIDVAVVKYCDLIPMERYSQIAKRAGFPGLPPQSLIELTHYLADFLDVVYQLIKGEILAASILYADETTHRMLEGDERSGWYLWGFSTPESCYFECHDTRSGDVASDILLLAESEYLVSDVYSGYQKATSLCNKEREKANLPALQNVYCNAHARRKFKELGEGNAIGDYFINCYKEIYKVEEEIRDQKSDVRLKEREKLVSKYTGMRDTGLSYLESISSKNSEAGAINYFLNNFEGLTRFLGHADLPIDNNASERLLRNPVVGRKTWYGTHSKRGAETAAKLFSIVESCKLNKLSPRSYLEQLVKDMHQKVAPYTPKQAAEKSKNSVNTC